MIERRKTAAPHAEASSVYLGCDAIGSILVVQKGRVTALDAAGKRLGVYKSDRETIAAILAVARAAQEAAK